MMSALYPKADIAERDWDVRFVPEADIKPLEKIDEHQRLCCRSASCISKHKREPWPDGPHAKVDSVSNHARGCR
jgi:uncharacterized Fe-S cluster protein YjdI